MLYKKPNVVKFQYGNKLLPNSRSNFNPNYIDPNSYLEDAQYKNSLLKEQQSDYSVYANNMQLQQRAKDNTTKMAGANVAQGLSGLAEASRDSKTGEMSKMGGKAGNVAKGLGWMQFAYMAKDMGKSLVKRDEMGVAKTKEGKVADDWMTPHHEQILSDLKDAKSPLDYGRAALLDSGPLGATFRGISTLSGNSNKTSGFWGGYNKLTGQTQRNKKVSDAKNAIDSANAAENARIAEERRLNTGRADEMARYQSILNNANRTGLVMRKGGKLLFQKGGVLKFRRGGELDVEKENVILDGPSHDEHNNTGVKNDKGLPVVKHGVKIAEIESKELVLNDKSSKEIETLVKQYNRTKDPIVLKKIGHLMGKEINTNTYDYSKELIIN